LEEVANWTEDKPSGEQRKNSRDKKLHQLASDAPGVPIFHNPEVNMPPLADEPGPLSLDRACKTCARHNPHFLPVHSVSLTDHEVREVRRQLVTVTFVNKGEEFSMDKAVSATVHFKKVIAFCVCSLDLASGDVKHQAGRVLIQLCLQDAAHIKLPLLNTGIPAL
jgi:hypothetical protein